MNGQKNQTFRIAHSKIRHPEMNIQKVTHSEMSIYKRRNPGLTRVFKRQGHEVTPRVTSSEMVRYPDHTWRSHWSEKFQSNRHLHQAGLGKPHVSHDNL